MSFLKTTRDNFDADALMGEESEEDHSQNNLMKQPV